MQKTLRIDRSLIGCWYREYSKQNPFPGNGNPRDEENYQLKCRIRDAEEERDILKKALAVAFY